MDNNHPNLILYNIGTLISMKGHSKKPKIGEELNDLGIIDADIVACKDEKIVFIGNDKELYDKYSIKLDSIKDDNIYLINVDNGVLMPGFVDSHTHLIFGGSREHEFEMKLKGYSYLDILKSGGGILSTVEATRNASEEELLEKAIYYAENMIDYGTTTVEIKSGYGLNPETELKMLKVADMLKKEVPLNILVTYLGAHTFPKEYKNKREEYIKQVIDTLPEAKKYATFCDIFCEDGAFTIDESKYIMREAEKQGFKIKLHVGQFNSLGGDLLSAELGAVSADHLDYISDEGIERMKEKGVIAVTLPGVPYHLMTGNYAPLRKMIEKQLPVALATDFNPGSCPCYNMQTIMDLACHNQKASINEVLSMSTINAAHALGIADKTGSIEVGKQADMIVLSSPDYRTMVYNFGVNHIHETIIKGQLTSYQIDVETVI